MALTALALRVLTWAAAATILPGGTTNAGAQDSAGPSWPGP